MCDLHNRNVSAKAGAVALSYIILLNSVVFIYLSLTHTRTHTQDFREKNTDHMRPDIVALLKSSKNAFICGLIGIDPSATFRWAVLRAYFRALVAFRQAGKRHTHKKHTGKNPHQCING